jgi:hypothetical protein
MDRNLNLELSLKSSLADYNPVLELEGDAYKLHLNQGDKRIKVTWPYPLMEVYFDFWDGETIIFSESFEFYENETHEELAEYLVDVAKKYLTNQTRTITIGKFLKRKELQFNDGSEWSPVF